MEPTIDQLTEALEKSQGKTPREVIDAFCPERSVVGGLELVPIKAGHELFLSKMQHPLASREPMAWGAQDVAVALFVFTRPSRELFRMVEQGTFEDELHGFLDEIPVDAIDTATASLMAHWLRSRSTVVSMSNPHAAGGSKKKAALVGSSH